MSEAFFDNFNGRAAPEWGNRFITGRNSDPAHLTRSFLTRGSTLMILQARQVQLLDLPPLTAHTGKRTRGWFNSNIFRQTGKYAPWWGTSFTPKQFHACLLGRSTLSSPTTVSPQAA